MKAALDTNGIIDLCNSEDNTNTAVTYFSSHPDDALVLLEHVMGEFDLTRLDANGQANFHKLEVACVYDTQEYFTIGQSTIGGPDVIRSDAATKNGIQRKVIDIQSAYNRYKAGQIKGGHNVKPVEEWNKRNNHQSDAVIYERATELGCDYLVTTDGPLKKAVPATNNCKPVTLSDFVTMLGTI